LLVGAILASRASAPLDDVVIVAGATAVGVGGMTALGS
jgi:hypothetical protein